jgi:hypothetical protein
MIHKDRLAQWRDYEMSGQVIKAMQEEKDQLLNAMESGVFVNPSNMEDTFGGITKATGKMEGLNTFFNIIGGENED